MTRAISWPATPARLSALERAPASVCWERLTSRKPLTPAMTNAVKMIPPASIRPARLLRRPNLRVLWLRPDPRARIDRAYWGRGSGESGDRSQSGNGPVTNDLGGRADRALAGGSGPVGLSHAISPPQASEVRHRRARAARRRCVSQALDHPDHRRTDAGFTDRGQHLGLYRHPPDAVQVDHLHPRLRERSHAQLLGGTEHLPDAPAAASRPCDRQRAQSGDRARRRDGRGDHCRILDGAVLLPRTRQEQPAEWADLLHRFLRGRYPDPASRRIPPQRPAGTQPWRFTGHHGCGHASQRPHLPADVIRPEAIGRFLRSEV